MGRRKDKEHNTHERTPVTARNGLHWQQHLRPPVATHVFVLRGGCGTVTRALGGAFQAGCLLLARVCNEINDIEKRERRGRGEKALEGAYTVSARLERHPEVHAIRAGIQKVPSQRRKDGRGVGWGREGERAAFADSSTPTRAPMLTQGIRNQTGVNNADAIKVCQLAAINQGDQRRG